MTQNAQLSGVTRYRKRLLRHRIAGDRSFSARCRYLPNSIPARSLARVTDVSGAVVADAAITVTNTGTGIQRALLPIRTAILWLPHYPTEPMWSRSSASGFADSKVNQSDSASARPSK